MACAHWLPQHSCLLAHMCFLPLPPPCIPPWPLPLQVLVYHDLLGMMQHPHHAKVTPKFCKQYSAVGAVIQEVGRVSAAHWCWCSCCPALQLSLPCAWLLASPRCPEVSAGGFRPCRPTTPMW